LLNAYQNKKEPDILEVISDLSNDEVFTPPAVAKQMLDLLPSEVWSNPALRWIDPFTKTGVFLRETTKRLLVGLREAIPDDTERLDHILRNMVFGVAITELTSLMSRRSLYCSKWADSDKSVVKFLNKQGNLIHTRVNHEFFKGRCSECLAGELQHGGDLQTENYAYALLHQEGRRFIEKEIGLKFDVVLGNPPYQMDGGGGGTNATPLYNLFIEQAIQLQPSHILMVTPSRWMAGGRGLERFREKFLGDVRLKTIVDFPDASDVFPGQSIEGGVSYFHWDSTHKGPTQVTNVVNGVPGTATERKLDEFDVFVRNPEAVSILRKVLAERRDSVIGLISGDTPFGLATNFRDYRQSDVVPEGFTKIYANLGNKRVTGVMPVTSVPRNRELINKWKIFVPEARGSTGVPDIVLGTSILAEPNSVCSQTYLIFGPFNNEAEAKNALTYLKSKFFRFLVSLRKITQHALRSTYTWVPLVDFSRPWTDLELYKEFDLSPREVEVIEALIEVMS
jgi:site-specific DNA-methyltransferase (adenine-specific)